MYRLQWSWDLPIREVSSFQRACYVQVSMEPCLYLIVYIMHSDVIASHSFFLSDERMEEGPCVHLTRVTSTVRVDRMKICGTLFPLQIHLPPRH